VVDAVHGGDSDNEKKSVNKQSCKQVLRWLAKLLFACGFRDRDSKRGVYRAAGNDGSVCSGVWGCRDTPRPRTGQRIPLLSSRRRGWWICWITRGNTAAGVQQEHMVVYVMRRGVGRGTGRADWADGSRPVHDSLRSLPGGAQGWLHGPGPRGAASRWKAPLDTAVQASRVAA
jgi:hypothetical protein